jgi:ComF family protein
VVRELVHGFKYSGKRSMSGFLSGLMAGPVNDDPGIIKGIGAVTFVPLHRTGMARRGFNQSELLANGFAARFSLPVLGVLEKKRRTKNQNELSRIDRLRNLKGVFSVKKDADDIKGCSLLLIDDVMTTGATLSECARVLKESGAKEVRCLTLARGA